MPSSAEEDLAPVAFRSNHSSAVCLPVLAGSRKLMWVHADQIELGGDGAAELDQAFSRFPYLSRKETAALAQRCSLHPDQVKVWFMAQRLQYGISWEWEDISNIRKAFRSEERRAQRVESDKDGEGKKAEKKTSAKEEEEGAEATPEKSTKVEKKVTKFPVVQCGKKKKQDMITGGVGKKRAKHDHGEKMEGLEAEWVVAEANAGAKKKKKKKKKVKAKDEEASLDGLPLPDSKSPSVVQSASLLTDNLSELLKSIDLSGPKLKAEAEAPADGADGGVDCKVAKKKSQTAMMRTAFLHCQYPNAQQYASMAALIGVSRTALVQWFNDTRYYIKKAKPHWMSHRQHRELVANVRYRQYLTSLAREQRGHGDTWDTMLEKLKSAGEEASARDTKPFTSSAKHRV